MTLSGRKMPCCAVAAAARPAASFCRYPGCSLLGSHNKEKKMMMVVFFETKSYSYAKSKSVTFDSCWLRSIILRPSSLEIIVLQKKTRTLLTMRVLLCATLRALHGKKPREKFVPWTIFFHQHSTWQSFVCVCATIVCNSRLHSICRKT